MNLLPLPAFDDNYIWMLHDAHQAVVVDPGTAAPVLQALQTHGITLAAILVTHHHPDHVGGLAALQQATSAPIYAPADEPMPVATLPVHDEQIVHAGGMRFDVMRVPGHTAGHAAYYMPDQGHGAPRIFCGDTLFSAGCGRLFEGTPAQMHASLERLSHLPDATQVCCAHEYTLSNLRFAQAVEPENATILHHSDWCKSQRERGMPTLPSTIALEREINPFLRLRHSAVQTAVRHRQSSIPTSDPVAVLAALRQWKNEFR